MMGRCGSTGRVVHIHSDVVVVYWTFNRVVVCSVLAKSTAGNLEQFHTVCLSYLNLLSSAGWLVGRSQKPAQTW